MRTGEPCTCEYVTLLQSFHRGTLSVHWYVAQNVYPTFSMSVWFRCLFRTANFSRFSKVAIATSYFMNEFYNCGFSPEFSASVFKKNHRASSRLCIRNKEIRSKTSRKIYMKKKYETFLQWNTKFFLQKFLFVLHFGSCQNCMTSANLVAENQYKLCNRRVLSTGEPCTCEYVTLLQPFRRGTLSIHWYVFFR